jgi:hypothetical protein
MAAPDTPTRMVYGYNNLFTLDQVTGGTPVALTNCSADAGTHENNLLYEDPYLRLVTTNPSGNPEIVFDCGSVGSIAEEHVLTGFVDWTESWRWDEIKLEAGVTSTGPWFEEWTLDLTPGGLELGENRKTVLCYKAINAQTPYWKFTISKASPPYYVIDIANFVMFRGLQIGSNPDSGAVIRARTHPSRVRRAAGGAAHVVRHAQGSNEVLQYKWSRMDKTSFKGLEEGYRDFGDGWVGAIPPEQAGGIWPSADHIIGRQIGLQSNARHGADRDSHVFQTTLALEGVF